MPMSSPRQKTAGSRSISSQIPWRMASRYVVWDMLLLLVTIVICAAPQHRTDNTRPGRALLASTGEGACAHVVRLISNALRPLFASDVQRRITANSDNTRHGRALLASTGEGACAHVVHAYFK